MIVVAHMFYVDEIGLALAPVAVVVAVVLLSRGWGKDRTHDSDRDSHD